jgi:hypothetical protein
LDQKVMARAISGHDIMGAWSRSSTPQVSFSRAPVVWVYSSRIPAMDFMDTAHHGYWRYHTLRVRALAALLDLAIEQLLPESGALPSQGLAATHTCFVMLLTLKAPAHQPRHAVAVANFSNSLLT